ncbi:MAG: phenylalanine--tRNA ligase subunit beta [Salinisphaera sp.]|jgi:phenylalanyl-tRNA synthetase beta chain|nr:phenylalanine--tRNA ligase subunit beta [Salinisphaera sp.]
MKISEQWLREWVDTDADVETIAERLTMAGLEVDSIEPAGPSLQGIVVGEVLACDPHPDADRLKVCRVDIGAESLDIVCGAPNVAVGLRVPVATVGTRMPDGTKIKAARLRGVASSGMLCSASELQLSSESNGLWLLPPDAPVGTSLADYLGLPDHILEVDLTPNRGDCLSVRGIAREAAVAFDSNLRALAPQAMTATLDIQPGVRITAKERCAGYAAQHVGGLAPTAATPVWMHERLRRSGVRVINLPVDIGNYVMLETGQPMHAFDADKLAGDIVVRLAGAGERIVTLDGETVELSDSTLVIADDDGPVAIAGMIGGQRTAVDDGTRNVVFESACFTPAAVAGQGRRYKIHTDALHRFERGVDPELHESALAQATRLLCELAGADCGPVIHVSGQPVFAEPRTIGLDAGRLARLLGQAVDHDVIERSLTTLGAKCSSSQSGQWQVQPPSWRYDLAIEVDLIEEVARVYGYDRLQAEAAGVELPALSSQKALYDPDSAAAVLRQRGYHEAITFSFVEPELHDALTGVGDAAIRLDNPISDQLVDMRQTLWAGLLPAWAYNTRRQQTRVRLYEQGLRFVRDESSEHGIAQRPTIAGLAAGPAEPAHWDQAARPLDFFDVRGDVEALFAANRSALTFEAAEHQALHPGRSARICLDGCPVGWIGQLAPAFARRYKGQALPYLFEVDADAIARRAPVRYQTPSDQPRVRRDLALLVPEGQSARSLLDAIQGLGDELIQSIDVFDVFRGEGVESGFKSVALSLIFQDKTSTLDDSRVDSIITTVTGALRSRCGARLRGEESGVDQG